MPVIQSGEYSPENTPYEGVIPQPHVSALGGESYKYAAKGGKKHTKKQNKKQQKRTKKAKQNRRSRRTRSNR